MDIKDMDIAEISKAIEETEQLLWDLRERRMELALLIIQEREVQHETVS